MTVPHSYTAELELAVTAARAAGALLREAFGKAQQILSQEGRDVKLQADRDAEGVILACLQASEHPVLAEESGEHGDFTAGKPFWMVDPLDGTVNFSRGIPNCAVSIGWGLPEAPRVGVVYDFLREELFTAVAGEGAWLNGAPIRVSEVTASKAAILGSGMPVNMEYSDAGLREFAQRIQRFKKVRLIGSAALSLSYLACGRFDAYSEDDIMLWDVAAGLALVQGAGGWMNIEPAQKDWAYRVRCATQASVWHP